MLTIRHQKSGRFFNYLRFAYHFGKSFHRFFGAERLQCPVCDSSSRFLAFGQPPRYNAMCPSCGSFERHRMLYLWLTSHAAQFKGADILHFAPEEKIEAFLRDLSNAYVSADYMPGKADRQVDIEKIDAPEASFDLILCIHVLEHVDDHMALAEMFRVLKPGGTALLMFPIIEGWARTLEETDIGKDSFSVPDRIKYFGQYDHVRYYGRDVRDRIRAAGFELIEQVAQEPEVGLHGLMRGETIFCAVKPA